MRMYKRMEVLFHVFPASVLNEGEWTPSPPAASFLRRQPQVLNIEEASWAPDLLIGFQKEENLLRLPGIASSSIHHVISWKHNQHKRKSTRNRTNHLNKVTDEGMRKRSVQCKLEDPKTEEDLGKVEMPM
jgi:hypothetical protein